MDDKIAGQESAYPLMDVQILGDNSFHPYSAGGLTKRELFAAMAMQGFCTGKIGECSSVSVVANLSVKQADALLKELSKNE